MRWQRVKDYPLYEVSDLGEVKSYQRPNVILKTLHKTKKGYSRVRLVNDNGAKSFQVHRIVAINFIPNPQNLPVVNHKDGNKKNNCVTNLEWCTTGENQSHAYRIGLRKQHQGSRHGRAILDETKVLEIRKRYQAGGTSMPKLAAEFGVCKSSIGYIVSNQTWTHV